jgi:hypothetical protein
MTSFSATSSIRGVKTRFVHLRRPAGERPHSPDSVSSQEPAPARRSDGGIDTDRYIVRARQLRGRTQAAWLLRLYLWW